MFVCVLIIHTNAHFLINSTRKGNWILLSLVFLLGVCDSPRVCMTLSQHLESIEEVC